MTILSTRAVSRLAERHVYSHADAIPIPELVKTLEALDVDHDRAHAGIKLAVDSGRLLVTPSGLTVPTFKSAA